MLRVAVAVSCAFLLLCSSLPVSGQQTPAGDLTPFSPDTNFLSQAGFRRWVMAELAPTRRLRAAIAPNPVLATRDPATREVRGVAADLVRELAARAGLTLEILDHGNIPIGAIISRLVQGATTGAWDLAFTAAEPDRLAVMNFTPAFLEIDLTLLVRPGSTIRTVAEADRPGIRIAVARGAATDRYLSTALRQADLVRVDNFPAAIDLLRMGRVDAVGAGRGMLLGLAQGLPGSRVLPDRYTAEQLAIALPKGRAGGLQLVSQFVEWAKASGFIQQAIQRHGVRGVQVPAPAGR